MEVMDKSGEVIAQIGDGGLTVTPQPIPQPRRSDYDLCNDLLKLVSEWEISARRQFGCAERTEGAMEKKLVEHGAMCYFNCAQALRATLGEPLPQPSPNR
jgi:hypothetical protein